MCVCILCVCVCVCISCVYVCVCVSHVCMCVCILCVCVCVCVCVGGGVIHAPRNQISQGRVFVRVCCFVSQKSSGLMLVSRDALRVNQTHSSSLVWHLSLGGSIRGASICVCVFVCVCVCVCVCERQSVE